MHKKALPVLVTALMLSLGTGAFAYSFWGIDMGTTTYGGSAQLAFNQVGTSGAQYAVGGYQYTFVDGVKLGPFVPASPGPSYPVFRKFDADALFFMSDATNAKFMVLTGMPQTGVTAADVGYGSRQFGPGDLKLDFGPTTYGVGMRLDGLLWATDPSTTLSYFQIHKATGGVDDIHAQDAGTLGRVELAPQWDHVDNPEVPAGAEEGYAFYVKNSGTYTGAATVSCVDTGVSLGGANVYAYEVTVPWSDFGIGGSNVNFRASWRPTCGNDLIAGNFTGNVVPEPGSVILAIIGGIPAVLGLRRRVRSS